MLGIASIPFLGSQLLPNFKERDFLMHWLTPPGTSVTEETRISVSACRDLRKIDGVRNCGSHIGQAFLADEVYGVDFGENWISVSPEVGYDETLDKVQEVVESYPGLYRDVQTTPLSDKGSPRFERIHRGPHLLRLEFGIRSREHRELIRRRTGSSTPTPRSRPTFHTSRSSPTWTRHAGWA